MADREKDFVEELLEGMTMYGLMEASRDSDGKIDRAKADNLAASYGYSSADMQALVTSSEIRESGGYGNLGHSSSVYRELDHGSYSESTSAYTPINYQGESDSQEKKTEVKRELAEGRNYTDEQVSAAMDSFLLLFGIVALLYGLLLK